MLYKKPVVWSLGVKVKSLSIQALQCHESVRICECYLHNGDARGGMLFHRGLNAIPCNTRQFSAYD